ncbi:MAG: efflux RND transporter periplasmic adaptor subunit [Bythopirellula sp.]
MTKRIAIRNNAWLLSVLVLSLLSVGCLQSKRVDKPKRTATKQQAKKIDVAVVREQELKKTVELPATIESDETAMLMARVEAYVEKVLVDIGDEVKEGQALVELVAPELQQAAGEYRAMNLQLQANERVLLAELTAARSQLDVARAQLNLKRSERDRKMRLVSTGAIAQQLLEESEAEVQSQQAMLAKYENSVEIVVAKLARSEAELAVGMAKLEQAETLASYLEIKAPFRGVVAERNVDPGTLVRPASQSSSMKPLLVVAKVDKLRAKVHATTDIAGQLSVGQTVEFLADDVPGKKFEGQLSRMAGTYNQKTRMMQAEIDLANAPDKATGQRPLRAGSYGSATIVLQSAQLPVVPETALRTRGDRTSVVVVNKGACLVTQVTVAFRSAGMAAIAEGIRAGDQVVADPESVKDEQTLLDSEINVISW